MVEISVEKNGKKVEKASALADFETAISATGYGLFNYMFLLVVLPSCMATVYQTSTMSYIVPTAECDLKLQLLDKGILNAVTYAGMISSAIMWGYLADTMGRRKLLVIGYLLDAVCTLLSALTPNRLYLFILKYLGGFVVCGPFAVLMSYANEFHGSKHRPRIMMAIGCFFSAGTISLPMIAYGILPNEWNTVIFNIFVLRSWKVFLAIAALPSTVAGIAYIFLPESPKFLMTAGRNEEALQVFQMIYSINTRQPRDQYPIKELINEVSEKKSPTESTVGEDGKKLEERAGFMESIRVGLRQLKPMFSKPYLGQSIHVYFIQFATLLGLNTLRLWVPQLFAIISSYENNVMSQNPGAVVTLCTMISHNVNQSALNIQAAETSECIVDVDSRTYLNSAVPGITQLFGYFLAGALISKLGNKTILIIVLLVSGGMGTALIWATNSTVSMVLSSIFVCVGSIASTALLGVIANLFPTTLRTMILSLAMMFGRMGALIGNALFPVLLGLGCLPPFIMVGGSMLISAVLSVFLPSNVNKKPLV